MDEVRKLITEQNLLSHLNDGILIVTSPKKEALLFVKELLYRIVDRKTLLLLSGGKTPSGLYSEIAGEEKLSPGAVGIIDERYGKPIHDNSNQKMMQDSGLLRYFQMRDIPFYPVLKDKSRQDTAKEYDSTLRDLFSIYQRSIGLLGIGADGHTAGLPAQSSHLKVTNSKLFETFDYVTEYDDANGTYKERVTMTFAGLSMLDVIIILVFGEDKKEALSALFEPGSEQEIPARFYKRPDIARKTILITDQSI